MRTVANPGPGSETPHQDLDKTARIALLQLDQQVLVLKSENLPQDFDRTLTLAAAKPVKQSPGPENRNPRQDFVLTAWMALQCPGPRK